jgi:orotidine-5'-phosphate decarboxylase
MSATSRSGHHYLSTQEIPVRERLVFALDLDSGAEAKDIVQALGDSVIFYKLGLQLFMGEGYFELIQWLNGEGKKVFVDLKFFDVPKTVGSAVRQLRGRGIHFVTVHGNDDILRAAVEERDDLRVLAVTVLTSLDEHDIRALGFQVNIKNLVLSRARRSIEIGCDGVISSGLEASSLRKELGHRFIVVVPGIRPLENKPVDDQKRTVDVEEAFLSGADYIVVGRPIRNAQNPKAAAEGIQRRIAKLFLP